MGKSETATVSIGINIQIKDVLDAMDKDNYEEIRRTILTDYALIDDSNNCYNNTYLGIVGGWHPETDEYQNLNKLEYEEYKEYLTNLFKTYGDGNGYKGYETYEEQDPENLYHSFLSVPHHSLVETERWGHYREGANGSSSTLDISQLTQLTKEIHDQMKEMKIDKDNYVVSLIILQYSG